MVGACHQNGRYPPTKIGINDKPEGRLGVEHQWVDDVEADIKALGIKKMEN
jgi:hypothetical protein